MQAEANEAIREYAAAVDKAEDATDVLALFPNMFGSVSYLTKAGTPLVSLFARSPLLTRFVAFPLGPSLPTAGGETSQSLHVLINTLYVTGER